MPYHARHELPPGLIDLGLVGGHRPGEVVAEREVLGGQIQVSDDGVDRRNHQAGGAENFDGGGLAREGEYPAFLEALAESDRGGEGEIGRAHV